MMTSAQVVETSVTVTDNSPFQDYPHPDDHTTRSTILVFVSAVLDDDEQTLINVNIVDKEKVRSM